MTQLSIPSPCSEKWADMTPVRHYCRFCAACEKQIVDFTDKTDAEILEYLKKGKGKICGRFLEQQLNRPIRATTSNRGTNTRRGGLTAAAASVAALLAAQQPAENRAAVPVLTEQNQIDREKTERPEVYDYLEEQDTIRTLSGKVVEAESGEALIGGTVMVVGTNIGAMTDVEGVFSLELPLQMVQSGPVRLMVHYTGFQSVEVEVPLRIKLEDLALLPIELETGAHMTMGIVVTCEMPVKRSLSQRIRSFVYHFFH